MNDSRRTMTSWQLVFAQSRVNNGSYAGEQLASQNWHWPKETWFQKRRSYLRTGQRQIFRDRSRALT
jgi:hypothetical protein